MLDTGIEAEHPLGVLPQGFIAERHRLIVVCGRIFGFADPDDSAAAVPAIGREEFCPEGIRRGQGHAVKRGVLRTHPVVLLSPVLQIISVSVTHELLPFGGHLSRSGYEVIFGAEVVGIISPVDAPDIIQKAFERFPGAVIIEHRRKSLVQLMESLHAGENEVGALESAAQGLGHRSALERGVENSGMGVDKLADLRVGENLDGELRSGIVVCRSHHAVEQCRELLAYFDLALFAPGHEHLRHIREQTGVAIMQPHIVGGA